MNFNCPSEGVSEVSEQAHEQSVGKRSVVEGVSGVSGASERMYQATEWPVKTRLSETRNPPSLFLSALLDSTKVIRPRRVRRLVQKKSRGQTDKRFFFNK